ncbi:MAG: insulinase family protein [candidate division NC10 bacterium]|nr:insulinase family protein [candidate division NC10 bacterium]
MRGTRSAALTLILVGLLATGVEAREPEIFETTLANGLRVLLVEEHKAPVVTFHVWYRVGSRNEQPGRTGLAHLTEHMMFKGTLMVGGDEFNLIIMRNGGQDNAFTTQDYTGYYMTFPADRIHIPLELEPDRMVDLLLDPEEVTRERSVVMEERRLGTEDDPTGSLWEQLKAAAFDAHPYGNPVVGWMGDIRQLSPEDIHAFYKAYYIPNNAVLLVVGDFDRTELLPKIQEAFGSIPRGPEPPIVRSIEPPQRSEKRIILKRTDAEVPSVTAVYHVPNLTDPDNYALNVLKVILSGGKSARLYRHLVYEKQLALDAGAHYFQLTADPELFYLSASVLPGKTIEELEQALYAEIEQVQTELVSERELQKAKNQLEAEFLFGQESVMSLAWGLGSYEMVAGWRHWKAFLPGIRAVTPEDIQRVARRYFVSENRTVGILLPHKPVTQTVEGPTGISAGESQ